MSVAHRQLMEEIVTTAEYVSEFAQHHESVGEARGEARALLAILDARKIDISEEARAAIAGCTDMDLLEVWVRRALTVDKAADLFD